MSVKGRTRDGDPFDDPATSLEVTETIRRLMVIEYSCNLCAENHSAEFYVTAPAGNTLEDLLKLTAEGMDIDGHRLLGNMCRNLHDEQGDLETLETALAHGETPRREAQWFNIYATDETEYTCSDCGQTFPTVGHYRLHAGLNPETARRERKAACL